MFHQSKALSHHLAWFSFHCPFSSTWYCIWCSLRWSFTEWRQGCFMLPCFYCWTICEWLWVLQSVPRHPWDWLRNEISSCWVQILVSPVLKLCKFRVILIHQFFQCLCFICCVYAPRPVKWEVSVSVTAGLCNRVMQIPDLLTSPPSPDTQRTGFWLQGKDTARMEQKVSLHSPWSIGVCKSPALKFTAVWTVLGAITIVREVSYLFNPKVIFSCLGKVSTHPLALIMCKKN